MCYISHQRKRVLLIFMCASAQFSIISTSLRFTILFIYVFEGRRTGSVCSEQLLVYNYIKDIMFMSLVGEGTICSRVTSTSFIGFSVNIAPSEHNFIIRLK